MGDVVMYLLLLPLYVMCRFIDTHVRVLRYGPAVAFSSDRMTNAAVTVLFSILMPDISDELH